MPEKQSERTQHGTAHHGTAMTHSQIAEKLGLSRHGVELIEKRALAKLKNNFAAYMAHELLRDREHEQAMLDSNVSQSLRFAKLQRSK